MPETKKRPLKVFLCHASDDKPIVRELYRQLCAEGWLDVWLDEEKLLPGQEWDLEIEKAVEEADVVLICLSSRCVDKEGYIQKELRFVLNIADQKPEGAIFIIPIRLNDCPVPRRLRNWQYVDYFPKDRRKWAYERILQSLKLRAARLGLSTANRTEENARREAEQRTRKEAEEKARNEKEDRARKAAVELRQKQAEDRAWREKENQPNGAAVLVPDRGQLPPSPQLLPNPARQDGKIAGKPQPVKKVAHKINFVPFGIGAIALLVFTCGILGVNYVIKHWPAAFAPAVTVTPTSTFTPKPPTATPTPTPGIGSTQVSGKDGMVMMYVPKGFFSMGDNSYDAPIHSVYLDAFWIDQTEVTNKMYGLCVAAGQCDPPVLSDSSTHPNYYGNPEYDNYSVIYVSWNDANAYCGWADRRLPTEAEWEKAARGMDGRTYPWGEGIDCNKANYYDGSKYCVGDTSRVGSYENGISPYGAYDMAGNVLEWVADWYSYTYYASSPSDNPTGPASGDSRVLRGGAWYDEENSFSVRSAYRYGEPPSVTTNFIGFRCSRSP